MVQKSASLKRILTWAIIAAIIIVAVWYMFGYTRTGMFYFGDHRQYKEARAKTVLGLIQDEDMGAMKALFSKDAVASVGEDKLEEGIDLVFSVFEGDVVSYKVYGLSEFGLFENGKEREAFRINIDAKTDAGDYYIYFSDYVIDMITPGKLGVNAMMVVKSGQLGVYGPLEDDFTGIFRQDIIDRATQSGKLMEDKLAAVVAALENKDRDALKGLFSNNATSQHIDTNIEEFDKYVDAVFSKFEGSAKEIIIANHKYEYVNISEGEMQMRIKVFANVITDEGEYSISFRYILDETDLDDSGIELIQVLRGPDEGYLDDRWFGISY